MRIDLIRPRLLVQMDPQPFCTILASSDLVEKRQVGHGVVTHPVQGYPNAWWVKNLEDDSIAPYWFHELDIARNPPAVREFSL